MSSNYKIDLANNKVGKQIKDLPAGYKNSVIKHLLELEINPRPKGVKKLEQNIYRIRIGRYRVIYEINDKDKLVVVTKVAKRDESTYI